MAKHLLTCLFLLLTAVAMGQKKSVVNLINSDGTAGVKRNGVDILKVYRGTFQQENSTLSSDSAYFYQASNYVEAFGHVNINQGDTLNVYSDKLTYNGNTHIALLTDNVRLVDRDATLTTNYMTYNTATRIGTYTGGGKLVNKDNTLVSRNGYYFAFSRDSYFRYNVVLTTADATIKTDTLRYNSGSRIAYFYGPTHILGKKDKDTLYTENGTYNTVTEQAFFGKRNRYSQNTKSLKGDSLFYDRLKGYGRAVKNVTFNDTEQRITMKGDLGTYFQADQRAVVTRNAYVVLVTEDRDTTKKDTAVLQPVVPAKGKNVKLPTAKPPADTAVAKTATASLQKAAKPLLKPAANVKRDSIYMAADTLETQIVTYKYLKELQEKRRLAGIKDTSQKPDKPVLVKKKLQLSTSKFLIGPPPRAPLPVDSSYLRKDMFGIAKKRTDTTQKQKPPVTTPAKNVPAPAVAKKLPLDSVYMVRNMTLSDTSRIRILSAHHQAKIFKSDLQAKADSMFYSYSDSTVRCYINPMIWSQGSQISGDTIHLELKNKKLDNMDVFKSAFMVNIEAADSAHFNQLGGKKIRGYFRDSKLYRMYVDGNAESIYYIRDSTKKVSGMQRSLSSRIKVNLSNNNAEDLRFYSKPEHRYGALEKFTEDDRILKGFIWKPKDRPVSKESIIASYRPKPQLTSRKPVTGKASANTAKVSAKGKTPAAVVGTGKPGVKDSIAIKPVKDTLSRTTKIDSTIVVNP